MLGEIHITDERSGVRLFIFFFFPPLPVHSGHLLGSSIHHAAPFTQQLEPLLFFFVNATQRCGAFDNSWRKSMMNPQSLVVDHVCQNDLQTIYYFYVIFRSLGSSRIRLHRVSGSRPNCAFFIISALSSRLHNNRSSSCFLVVENV